MSILSAIRQQSGSIDDLAKLPQAMIMQMAQRKQISTEMVAPILARKAEMIDAAAKSKAMQGGLPQTSVMEQIIAQNSAAEQPQQIPQIDNAGVAQLPVPERQYAGGGIIAFAKGSMIDLDDDEIDASDDYAKAAAMVQRANAMPVGMPATMPAAMPANAPATMPVNAPAAKPSILPQSYEAALAEKGQTPASVRKMMIDSPKKGDYVMPPMDVPKRGGHKYEDMVIKEAQRLGVDPSLALHVLYKETGNLKNPETAKSSAGALGVMQLMPKTAKGLGVDPLDPEENIRGGVTYLKQMYDKYNDPTLALAAYNAGPGRLDKALKSGQGIAGLPRETQNYIVANRMASGGEVKHFAFGGIAPEIQEKIDTLGSELDESRVVLQGLESFGSKQRQQIPEFDNRLSEAKKRRSELQSQYEKLMGQTGIDKAAFGVPPMGLSGRPREANQAVKQLLTDNKTATVPDKPAQNLINIPANYMPDESEGPYIKKPLEDIKAVATPTPVKEKTAFEMFMEQNDLDRAALGKQRSEDRNMALLAAGLGMLGGESPYAFSNIGKGGLSGVSYLSDANKQRAAQQAALDKNRVAAMHYANIGKYYDSQTLGKEERLGLEREKMLGRQLGEKEKLAQNRAIAALKVDLTAPLDPQTKMKIDNYIAQDLAKDKSYNKMYEQMYGFPYELGSSASVSTKDFKLVK
jgi:soluble lytic murein transglycosylase-like protein